LQTGTGAGCCAHKDIRTTLDMNLEQFLLSEKRALVTKWFDLVAGTYPPETARLLKKESNQFANPVGHTILHGLSDLFEQFLGGAPKDSLQSSLDGIIRIRAIQDFTPSQAVSFVFLLKRIVADRLQDESLEERYSAEDLLVFYGKVDELALLAFDIYMQCREKLYEVRVNEVKNRTFRLLQRANLLAELPDKDPEPGQSDS
jgi:hypothetical protein